MTQQNELMFALCSLSRKRCNTKRQVQSGEKVWSSGKTLLDLPWSNGTHHWPMAIFAHTKRTMVLHLCRTICSLIHVFVAFRSSYRCLYRFTCAKIPNLLAIWEGTCFVSCSFVANQKDHRKMLVQKKKDTCSFHALYMHFLWLWQIYFSWEFTSLVK